MTTRSLRTVALGVTVLVAVLTGLFTGFVGASSDCSSTVRDDTEQIDSGENRDAEEQQKKNQDDANEERNKDSQEPTSVPTRNIFPNDNGGGAGASTLADDEDVKCEESFSFPAAALGFGGALLSGLVVFILIGARSSANAADATAHAPVAAASYPVPAPAAPSPSDGQAEQQRRSLVETLIYVRDRATSPAIAERVGTALRSVGVTELSPAGVTFDPAQHEAGGFVATSDANLNGTIAAVETVGYSDQGTILRAPVVTVYRVQNS
ncbi:MAG: nucleotide exchange factor GrpE [Corynebacteriales bacterium]|nr:nucleotide exchange factor GrpE [Mycobacteriales bacterium]